jgi:hypothetical protein
MSIADEVEEEEGRWVGIWRLHLGVGLEGAISDEYYLITLHGTFG